MIDLSDFTPGNVERLPLPDDPRIRFNYRSRTTGIKQVTCIYCGQLNTTRITPEVFTVKCIRDKCRRTIGFGDIAYVLHNGPRVAPRDIVIPRGLIDTFPEGDIHRWSSGQPIHQLAVLRWPEDR